MKKEKGAIGCISCGTSIGCFFPLALVFGVFLIAAGASYFDPTYRWSAEETWLVVFLMILLVPAILVGILQALVGAWSLMGFFDQDVTPDDASSLPPIPPVDGEQGTDKA